MDIWVLIVFSVFLIMLAFIAIRIYMSGATNPFRTRLDGKNILVTGGTAGIGAECVYEFARLGAKKITFTGRDTDRARAVQVKAEGINSKCKIQFVKCDMSDLAQVDKFAKQYVSDNASLDILLNNAGGIVFKKYITKQGFESNVGINYVSSVLLTSGLIPILKNSPDARIVNVSSMAHYLPPMNKKNYLDMSNFNYEKQYSAGLAYG
jgi:NAD(P)-dependent dehydrogenase (short-subunit alcohol dehydrogenase family)